MDTTPIPQKSKTIKKQSTLESFFTRRPFIADPREKEPNSKNLNRPKYFLVTPDQISQHLSKTRPFCLDTFQAEMRLCPWPTLLKLEMQFSEFWKVMTDQEEQDEKYEKSEIDDFSDSESSSESSSSIDLDSIYKSEDDCESMEPESENPPRIPTIFEIAKVAHLLEQTISDLRSIEEMKWDYENSTIKEWNEYNNKYNNQQVEPIEKIEPEPKAKAKAKAKAKRNPRPKPKKVESPAIPKKKKPKYWKAPKGFSKELRLPLL